MDHLYSLSNSQTNQIIEFVNGMIESRDISIWSACALAKLCLPGHDLPIALVLMGLLLRHQVLALPPFTLAYQPGILNTYVRLFRTMWCMKIFGAGADQ
ncbi:hypothetical protein [Bradyrhizobium genosp. A]|uniref:hypothetical protein n=1 Tax=Bradyrhizobium genosp. A TaxID=83626 RepID=UPI003CF17F12